MTVLSSTATLEGAQADGSRWCREVHTIPDGTTVEFYYSTPPGFTQANAIAAARAADVADWLAAREAEDNIERDGPPSLVHQTPVQFAVRLREYVRSGERERACQLAWWLLRRIADGHITDAQARAAFGLTVAQWTNFKSSTLIPRSNAWASMLAAEGA